MQDFVFQTERLDARPWDPDAHAAGALEMYGDPEVARYIGGILMRDEAEQRAFILTIIDRIATLDPGLGSWPLFERASGELVGTALLKPLPASGTQRAPSGDIEIGWHLARKHWKRGFATEAGHALLHRGFETLGLPVLHAVVEPANTASQAVARRLGMRDMGRTERYYDLPLEHFELGAAEWRARAD